jgi:hypothetical protein
VTTGSGSRDGGAGRSHEDAGGDGGAGARDDDPELRGMRAVWLSMRDEAPPDGGLAELLAAARAKAETMQARPTFWQRLVTGLGRPPALALATVMVLVGGAVILARHADPTAGRRDVSRSAEPEMGSGLGAPPPAGEAPGPMAPAAAPVAPTVAGAGSRGSGASLDDTAELGALKSSPVAGSTEAPAARGASTGAYDRARASGAAAPSEVPTAEGAAMRDDAPRFKEGEAKKHDARADVRTTAKAVSPASSTRPGSQGDALAQLYLQCESAARRGDCTAVKRIVGRITAADRGYRARLAKDSPIAQCLAD